MGRQDDGQDEKWPSHRGPRTGYLLLYIPGTSSGALFWEREGSGLVGWELAVQERKKGQNTGNPVEEEGRNAKSERRRPGTGRKQGRAGRGGGGEKRRVVCTGFMLFMAFSSTFPSSRPGNSRSREEWSKKPTSQFNHTRCSAP